LRARRAIGQIEFSEFAYAVRHDKTVRSGPGGGRQRGDELGVGIGVDRQGSAVEQHYRGLFCGLEAGAAEGDLMGAVINGGAVYRQDRNDGAEGKARREQNESYEHDPAHGIGSPFKREVDFLLMNEGTARVASALRATGRF
jgi:hypothetical protein